MPNGSIGTPLDNAIGYGCFAVAHLLAARGVPIDKLWHAAALGKFDRLEELLALDPDGEQVSQAFWHACAASQRRAAERLLAAGADLNWVPSYAEGTPLDAAGGHSTRQQNIIEWLQEQGPRTRITNRARVPSSSTRRTPTTTSLANTRLRLTSTEPACRSRHGHRGCRAGSNPAGGTDAAGGTESYGARRQTIGAVAPPVAPWWCPHEHVAWTRGSYRGCGRRASSRRVTAEWVTSPAPA
jgi:hypothetical protein